MFMKHYGVQKYANHDPAPHLRFENSWEPPRYTSTEKWLFRILWVLIFLTLVWMEI